MGGIVQAAGTEALRTNAAMMRSEGFPIELQFLDANGDPILAAALPQPTTAGAIAVIVKAQGVFDGASLIADATFSEDATNKLYKAVINFNTDPLNTLFKITGSTTDDVATLSLQLAFLYVPTGGVPVPSNNIVLTLNNNVARGDEDVPAAVARFSPEPTGTVKSFLGSSAPTGYVIANGGTIGDASSSGSSRANADTSALFTLLWNTFADAQCPVVTGRGVSAAADFAAHKKITLPDSRGRVLVGAGGTAFTTLGDSVGEEKHLLLESELPSHTHDVVINGAGSVTASAGADVNALGFSGGATVPSGAGTGGGLEHGNIQPSLVIGCHIIKL